MPFSWDLFNQWLPHLGRMTKAEGYVVSPGEEARLVVGLQPQRRGTQWMDGLMLEYRQGARHFQTEVGPRVVIKVQR